MIKFYNNNPCNVVRVINETFSEVEVFPQFDTDMNGGEWCTECMVGNQGTPQAHTCEAYQDVIDAIRDTESSILVVVENRLLADKPIEFLKWSKLRDEIETKARELEITRNVLFNSKEDVLRLEEYNLSLREDMFTLENDIQELEDTKTKLTERKWELLREVHESEDKVKVGSVMLDMSSSDLKVLLENTIQLECLEKDGVDNWEWYGESFLDDEEMIVEVNNRMSGYKVIGLS